MGGPVTLEIDPASPVIIAKVNHDPLASGDAVVTLNPGYTRYTEYVAVVPPGTTVTQDGVSITHAPDA